jgi:circadian clock protein KaiC
MPTGVPGLDTVLGGGLRHGGVYLVIGPPGAGKTVLGNQICFAQAVTGARAIYLTLLSENHSNMLDNLEGLSFFDRRLIGDGLQYVSAYGVLEQGGLDRLLEFVRQLVQAQRPVLLAVDGLATLAEMAVSAVALKQFINQLQIVGSLFTCSFLLFSSLDAAVGTRAEHASVDGVIELHRVSLGLRSARELEIHKLRGSSHLDGRHAFVITRDGLRIYPRLEARFRSLDIPPEQLDRRLTFGVPLLDAMLGGGLQARSTTLLVGTTGSGKTLLGLRFLASGAEQGEPGLYVGFYETAGELRAKADSVGFGLSAHVDAGRVGMLWYPPYETLIDALAERIFEVLEEQGVRRLFLDGLEGIEGAAVHQERVQSFMMALSNTLKERGVTTIFSAEIRDLAGPTVKIPLEGISIVAGNIILMRQVELKGSTRHVLSVMKMRRSGYEPVIRMFSIGAQGIVMGDPIERVDAILTGTPRSVPARGRRRR